MSQEAPTSAVTWASSGAGGQVLGTPRHERILELHRLHFVKNKGNDAVKAKIEARCKESRAVDAKAGKQHAEKLQELHEKMTHKVKNAQAFGSMSLWTKEERDKIEEARRDPQEAKDKMAKEMQERARAYKDQQQQMNNRVRVVAAINIRTKTQWEEIEAVRQDPQEAKDRIELQLKHRKENFMEQRKAMTARVKAIESSSIRPKEERARIEELRQDPEEAAKSMQKHLRDLAKSYREEQAAMTARVLSRPGASNWTKEEWAELEDHRQDPEEAKQKARVRMKKLAQTFKEQQETMVERVKATPALNIRTKEERACIEEARQDPNEALLSARAHMKDLARTYQENKKKMNERVHCNDLVSFRSPRAQETVAQKILKNMPMH